MADGSARATSVSGSQAFVADALSFPAFGLASIVSDLM
jgi:hypothetical protein